MCRCKMEEKDAWEGRMLTQGCRIYGDQIFTQGVKRLEGRKEVQERSGRLKLKENGTKLRHGCSLAFCNLEMGHEE